MIVDFLADIWVVPTAEFYFRDELEGGGVNKNILSVRPAEQTYPSGTVRTPNVHGCLNDHSSRKSQTVFHSHNDGFQFNTSI